MFDKKKIELLSNDVSDLNKKIEDLKSSLNNILDTLEGDNFSKDWEEYQKYKEMKDKLPDIEEMYQLKRLKKLIKDKEVYWEKVEYANKQVVGRKANAGNPREFINAAEEHANNMYDTYTSISKHIDDILKYLRDKSRQKELIEVFKLYGISTKWIQP